MLLLKPSNGLRPIVITCSLKFLKFSNFCSPAEICPPDDVVVLFEAIEAFKIVEFEALETDGGGRNIEVIK